MRARFFIACWLLFVPLVATAHVGSPNVFFDGQAGPYPVRVVIRPPGVLPGVAQVDVRILSSRGVTNVSLQVVPWEAGVEAAPAPSAAVPVAVERDLFNASLWLMRGGSYNVRVTVSGLLGSGTAAVPLNSAALKQPAMSRPLVAILLGLGAILFLSAGCLAGAAARESTLTSDRLPAQPEIKRGRLVTIGSLAIVALGIYACAIRWQNMDREFRNNALYKPLPVTATVRTNGTLRLLQLEPSQDRVLASQWDTLVADHGKLMHLFLLREPDFDAFAHLHPVRRDARNFEAVLPALPAGDYRLYAEVTHENGLTETLTASVPLAASSVQVPQLAGRSNMLDEAFCLSPVSVGNSPQPFALDADDSWHIGRASARAAIPPSLSSRLMGGASMLFQNGNNLVENKEASLRFLVFEADGRPARLKPYMGMLGHAVVRRSDGEVFTHLHPVGTISMAAGDVLLRREAGVDGNLSQTSGMLGKVSGDAEDSDSREANEVTFPYAFPRSGDYRVWVQVRIGVQVLTGVFDVKVGPEG